MKTLKRALCLLLTLVTLASMFTVVAFAGDGGDATTAPATVKIVLNANYPDGGNDKVEFEAEEGTKLPLSTAARSFEAEGYVFDGWATSPNGNKAFKATTNPQTTWAKLVKNGVLELYALWKEVEAPVEPEEPDVPETPDEPEAEVFRVKIDYNRGEKDDITFITIEAGTAVELDTPTRYGYKFMGWYIDFEKYDGEPIYGPCTITAQWTGKYTDIEDGCNHYWGNNKHTVRYTDGVSGKTIFRDQVYTVKHGARTPEFFGTPVRAGYRFDGWTPRVTARVTKCVTYEATWVRATAPTLTKEHVAYIQGDPTGLVRPNDNITRAEAAAILYRLLSDKSLREYHTTKNPFTDVDSYAWYNTAVSTLYNAGIITGNGYRFKPEEAISRAELVAMLSRFSDSTWTGKCSFRDVDEDEWFYDEIALAMKYGWINGDEYGFRPNDSILRCEAVAMINRFLGRDNCRKVVDYTRWTDLSMDAWYYADMVEAGNAH